MAKESKTIAVLVIEDNSTDYLLIKKYLSVEFQYVSVTHAETALSAKTLLKSLDSGKYDAILLDLTLPDKSGEELIHEILKRAAGIPVIILTGFSNLDFSIKSLSMGISDYLLKDELSPPLLRKSILYSMERQAASMRLRESEQQFRSLFENAADAIFIAELTNGMIIDANYAAEKLLLRNRSDIAGMHQTELHPEELREIVIDLFKKHGAESEFMAFREPVETFVVRSDGTQIPVEILASRVRYRQQECLMGTFRDISERKQAETALRESERKLASSHKLLQYVIEHSNSGVAIHDKDLNYVYVSQKYIEQFQLDGQQVYGKNHYKIFPGLPQKWKDAHKRALKGDVLRSDKDPFVKSDGSFEWTRWECRPWYNSQGSIGGIIVYTEVITRELEVQEKLRISEASFRGSFEHAAIGMAIGDQNGLFLKVNDRFRMILGYSEDELNHRTFADLTTKSYLSKNLRNIYKIQRGDIDYFHTEAEFFTKDRTCIWCILSVSVVRESNGEVLYFIFQLIDINEKKLSQLALQDLNKTLEKKIADRTIELQLANKELESFSYSVSHDLRAPLRAIDGFSQAVIEDYSHQLDDTGQDYLNRVRAASQKLSRLIDEFLKLAKVSRSSIRTEQVNFSAIAFRILSTLEHIEPHRNVQITIQENMLEEADPELIQIALQNLLENAWKYTNKEETGVIEFGRYKSNNCYTYYVKDNGAGFDMKFYHHLFTPFKRLHNQKEYSGSGIGLATVKRIIDRHHGTIRAESDLDNGTTFYFELNKADTRLPGD